MKKYIDTVQDHRGNAIVGATVTVRNYPANTLATIYSDNGSTVIAGSQVTSDAAGLFQFYVADGRYTLEISGTGISNKTVQDVVIVDGNSPSFASLVITGIALNAVVFMGPGNTLSGDATNFTWNNSTKTLAVNELKIPSFVSGGLVFGGASQQLTQDPTKLFWDDANNRLGIGTATPATPLHVVGQTDLDGVVRVGVTSAANAVLNASGSALNTNATIGFTHVPSMAGTPVGTPTLYTGAVPVVYNTVSNSWHVYSGGSWRDLGSTNFLALTDTPSSYSGKARQLVSVKSTENGLEFSDGVSVLNGGLTFTADDTLSIEDTYNFTAMTMPVALEWRLFRWNGSIWVAAGASTGPAAIAYSYNGVNWYSGVSAPTNVDILCGAWNGSVWALPRAGNDSVYTSSDGITWTTTVIAGQNLGSNTHGNGIIAVGGTFLAVRNGLTVNYFYSSTNGTTWTQRTLFPASRDWNGFATNGTITVAVADTGAAYSLNSNVISSTWTAGSMPAATWKQVIWTGRCFFAVGVPDQTAARSYDGITWEAVSLPSNPSGIWGNIAANSVGTIALPAFYMGGPSPSTNLWTSRDDGTTWVLRTLPSSHYWQGCGTDGAKFVGASNDFFGGSTAGYYSDGGTYVSRALTVLPGALQIGSTIRSQQSVVQTAAGFGAEYSTTTFAAFAAGTTAKSSLRIAHGVAPTSPVNGDVWTTTSGLLARINGATRTFATLDGSETLTTKTINLASNTLTGTLAEFNTALSDADFATLAGGETLTNKTITTFGGALTFNPANLSATLSPTGTGTVTINPATAGTMNNMSVGQTTRAAGSFTALLASSSLGYMTGAGGTISQSTSKSTGVTLDKVCGTITMDGANLAADTTVAFTLTNSAIAATDCVVVIHDSVGTLGAYSFGVTPGAGSAVISVHNTTPGGLAEAIVLRFAVIKAVTS